MATTTYYDQIRLELVQQIPHTATKILDVGCGSGQTGLHLKESRDKYIEVVGIELVESVGNKAKENLDRVFFRKC